MNRDTPNRAATSTSVKVRLSEDAKHGRAISNVGVAQIEPRDLNVVGRRSEELRADLTGDAQDQHASRHSNHARDENALAAASAGERIGSTRPERGHRMPSSGSFHRMAQSDGA